MYRRHSSDLLDRNQPSKDNAIDGIKAVKVSFWRKHDVELKEKLLDKIIPNDSGNCKNWFGNGNSEIDAVAQNFPTVYTQLSICYSKHFEKRARQFDPISIQSLESAQWNPNGILMQILRQMILQMNYR